MKNLLTLIATCALLGGFILIGCNKEKQSSVNISDINTYADIVGSVNFEFGEIWDTTGVTGVLTMQYAVGKTIYVEVPNSVYTGSPSTEGYQTFSTKVADDGSYKISVPIPTSASNVTVNVYAQTFTSNYPKFVSLEVDEDTDERKPIYETIKRLYTYDRTPVCCINPGNTKVHPFTYTTNDIMQD